MRLSDKDKIAETSSKGNQEKWFDKENGKWYKLDQFGYEALSEVLVSHMLDRFSEQSEIPFPYVKYEIEKIIVHNRERVGCSSDDFLENNQSIITLNKLLSAAEGVPLKQVLYSLGSNRKRLRYLIDRTYELTGLDRFGEYLAVMFELDAVFLNTDRHLNNIAVLYDGISYDYCPFFDNGAALLSDMITARTDIEPKCFIDAAEAMPFGMSFTRQLSEIRRITDSCAFLPEVEKEAVKAELASLLEYYPERDRAVISDRVLSAVLIMQRKIRRIS